MSVGLGGNSSSRHRPGQVLADLAPRAKVVQTVVCSTFTRGAKPATRRVADGERMNPPGRGGAFAQIKETSSTRARSTRPRSESLGYCKQVLQLRLKLCNAVADG